MSKITTHNSKTTTVLKFSLLFLLVMCCGIYIDAETAQAKDPSLTEYTLLEPLPLGPNGREVTKVNASNYIPGLFRLTLAIAGVLVVLRMIYAGILYMSTDAYNNKNEAKEIISSALWGLALTLGAWILVATLFDNKTGSLDLGFKIPAQELPENTNPPGSGGSAGGGGAGVGCRGDCPYSYTNNGVLIKYKDCSSCSDAQSFGLNIKTGVIDGKRAQLSTSLGTQLRNMSSMPNNPAFQVTETWPPTVNHANQLQYDGRSVDASLNNPSASAITNFIVNAQRSGLTAQYEVRTAAARQAYINAGAPAQSILVVSYITGEHFSIK